MATYGEPLQEYLYHLSRWSLALNSFFLSITIFHQENLSSTPDHQESIPFLQSVIILIKHLHSRTL